MTKIKSFSVGNGDMFYIRHVSDNFTMIDCSLSNENRKRILDEIENQSSGKGVIRFISTHPDQDHMGGLVQLDDRMGILNFYCVKNSATKEDETLDFKRYCELRDHSTKAFHIYRHCTRKWMNQGDDERDAAGINILWPDMNNQDYKDALKGAAKGESPNNISPIIQYSLKDGVTVLWMGDLEADFMEAIKDKIKLPKADLLFAPHHGRESGRVPKEWLDDMDPGIIIIGEAPSKHLDYYKSYNTITQNSAGDIVFMCYEGVVHIYVSSSNYSVDFLTDGKMPAGDGHYLGTLETKCSS